MPRFFLIDPWLADAGGHNYQYALDVAGAAQRLGYDLILAVRESLTPDVRFPRDWRIEKLFAHGECPQHWIGLDGRNPHPFDLDGAWLPDSNIRWWQRLLDIPLRHDRRGRIVSFVKGCERLFAAVRPDAEDLVYFPSLSEFDFVSAVRFWRDHAWTREVDWHLQFHFNFLIGRDPEFVEQAELLRQFQQLFRAAVDQIPEHRIHFYTTTPALARQYNALGIAIFRPLPYPVRALSGRDQEDSSGQANEPLRVTLPGAMRHEKGKKLLGPLLDSTWEDFLQTGRVQYVFQASPAHLEQWLPARLRGAVRVPSAGFADPRAPLIAAPHPLDAEQYSNLICNSDIGLLVYDARRYFARVSGVLCEMLSAGVPVIVPAGCWLAEQICEENYRHVDSLWRQHQGRVEPIRSTEAGVLLRADVTARPFLVRFDWPEAWETESYAELIVRSAAGRTDVPLQQEILGSRGSAGPVGAVIRLASQAAGVRITLRQAYLDSEQSTPAFEVLPLTVSAESCWPPLGRVGLIAASEREIPRLLGEMTAHYEHYLRTAREFVQEWQARHSPEHTVRELESRLSGSSVSSMSLAAANR